MSGKLNDLCSFLPLTFCGFVSIAEVWFPSVVRQLSACAVSLSAQRLLHLGQFKIKLNFEQWHKWA